MTAYRIGYWLIISGQIGICVSAFVADAMLGWWMCALIGATLMYLPRSPEKMTAADLIEFEAEVARRFNAGEINSPIHLSGGNEQQIIDIFASIGPNDYVFSGHRSHYHALLKGIPRELVMERILAGKSMNLEFPEHRFYTSAIVGGCLPIAVGVAAALKRRGSDDRVWCFIGDMASTTGIFQDSVKYAMGHRLPIHVVVEDNGLSTDTPTAECWGTEPTGSVGSIYRYTRKWPHVGTAGKGTM